MFEHHSRMAPIAYPASIRSAADKWEHKTVAGSPAAPEQLLDLLSHQISVLLATLPKWSASVLRVRFLGRESSSCPPWSVRLIGTRDFVEKARDGMSERAARPPGAKISARLLKLD